MYSNTNIEQLRQKVEEFYNGDCMIIIKDQIAYIFPIKSNSIKLVTNDISIESDDNVNFYMNKKITLFELCELLQPEDPYTLYEEFAHKKIGLWNIEGDSGNE